MTDCLNVRNRETGEIFQCISQIVNLNFDGKYVLRYNIGINGHTEWSNVECIYNNDEFNNRYEVVTWNSEKMEWVAERY